MMLDAAGHLVLIDFGTCKDLWRPDLNGPEFCGTPGFMAPEMVASKPPAGAAVDLWALGCVAHQLLLGHPPFDAPSPYVFRGGEGGGAGAAARSALSDARARRASRLLRDVARRAVFIPRSP